MHTTACMPVLCRQSELGWGDFPPRFPCHHHMVLQDETLVTTFPEAQAPGWLRHARDSEALHILVLDLPFSADCFADRVAIRSSAQAWTHATAPASAASEQSRPAPPGAAGHTLQQQDQQHQSLNRMRHSKRCTHALHLMHDDDDVGAASDSCGREDRHSPRRRGLACQQQHQQHQQQQQRHGVLGHQEQKSLSHAAHAVHPCEQQDCNCSSPNVSPNSQKTEAPSVADQQASLRLLHPSAWVRALALPFCLIPPALKLAWTMTAVPALVAWMAMRGAAAAWQVLLGKVGGAGRHKEPKQEQAVLQQPHQQHTHKQHPDAPRAHPGKLAVHATSHQQQQLKQQKQQCRVWVVERPGLRRFLRLASGFAELVLFSAGSPE